MSSFETVIGGTLSRKPSGFGSAQRDCGQRCTGGRTATTVQNVEPPKPHRRRESLQNRHSRKPERFCRNALVERNIAETVPEHRAGHQTVVEIGQMEVFVRTVKVVRIPPPTEQQCIDIQNLLEAHHDRD